MGKIKESTLDGLSGKQKRCNILCGSVAFVVQLRKEQKKHRKQEETMSTTLPIKNAEQLELFKDRKSVV